MEGEEAAEEKEGKGGGGSGPRGAGLGSALHTPHRGNIPVNITAIVTASVQSATHGIAVATMVAQTSGTTAITTTALAPIKSLHLHMIRDVASNPEIPGIWLEVAGVTIKQVGLALLIQYIIAWMIVYHPNYLGHSNLLHCSVLLYNFVAGGRFANLGENSAYHMGSIPMWTTLKGEGGVGDKILTVDANLAALDS